jgi:hypothetical protein
MGPTPRVPLVWAGPDSHWLLGRWWCTERRGRKQRKRGTYEQARRCSLDLPGTLQSDRAAGASAAHCSADRGAGFATVTRLPRAAPGTARYFVHFQLKDPTYRTLPLKAIPWFR